MVYTIFLEKQGERVYTIGPERRVYTIEPQTQKKKKEGLHGGGVHFFLSGDGQIQRCEDIARRLLCQELVLPPEVSLRPPSLRMDLPRSYFSVTLLVLGCACRVTSRWNIPFQKLLTFSSLHL